MIHKRSIIVLLLLLVIAACNPKPDQQIQTSNIATKTPLMLPTQVDPSPTVSPHPTSTHTQVRATETPEIAVQLDPCNLVPKSSVEAIFEEPVQMIGEINMCSYPTLSNSRSIGIQVVTEEEAKKSYLAGIADFRDDCSISISYSTDQPTPTPLPPEIQELGSLSLLELIVLYEDEVLACGYSEDEYHRIENLGDYASFMALDLVFWKVGTVSVVLGDTLFTFNIVDPELDPAFALEAGESLAMEALERYK